MDWIPYRRTNPTSPVRCYQAGPNYMRVVLVSGKTITRYDYSASRIGSETVIHMARLAASGQGLGTYIAQHFPRGTVRYDSKQELPRVPLT